MNHAPPRDVRPRRTTERRLEAVDSATGVRPRVLAVGQGPPTAGGIPTFVTRIVRDPWLRQRVRFDYLNTTPRMAKSPGALTPANLVATLSHAATIARNGRHADVIHLNLAPAPTLPLLRSMVLSTAARLSGSRVILHAHSGRLEECLASPMYRRLLRLAARLVHEFVVVSSSTAHALARVGIRTVLVENGIDPTEFRCGPKHGDPPTLTFVGTVCERKGIIDLRDALLRMRTGGRLPLRVVVAGDGAQEGPGAFDRAVAAYREVGLDEVQFVGRLEREEVADLLARSDIFCLPSHWEGSPLSLLEGMASEAAPIASEVGGIPAILDNGSAGILVPSRDPVALSLAIDRLIKDPQERCRLARAARRRVEDHYAIDGLVRCLYDLYIAGRSRRASRSEAHSI